MDVLDLEIKRVHSLHAIEVGMLRLKWLAAATRFELAMRRHDRALKAGFNPEQPRVPRGQPEGGQWAGDSLEIPKERPPTSAARTAVLKQIARRLGPLMTVAEAVWAVGSWVHEYHAKINSYLDPPKSLEELQDAVSPTSRAGYQDHHIVEQTSAGRDGEFSRELIEGRDNVVRIPTMRHEDINGWYQSPNSDYNWQTPREYLRDKSWDERRAVGLKALIDNKVLKP